MSLRAFWSQKCPRDFLPEVILGLLRLDPCCVQANVIHISFIHAFIAAHLKCGEVMLAQIKIAHECGLLLAYS